MFSDPSYLSDTNDLSDPSICAMTAVLRIYIVI